MKLSSRPIPDFLMITSTICFCYVYNFLFSEHCLSFNYYLKSNFDMYKSLTSLIRIDIFYYESIFIYQ